jgi:hypothetical protein
VGHDTKVAAGLGLKPATEPILASPDPADRRKGLLFQVEIGEPDTADGAQRIPENISTLDFSVRSGKFKT